MKNNENLNRRRFLGMLAAVPAGAALLSACSDIFGQKDSTSQSAGQAAAPTPNNLSTTSAATTTAATASATTVASVATVNPTTAAPVTTVAPTKPAVNLPVKGTAPDFSNTVWINSEPLTLAALRGKVVMMEFWTFGCINCQNVTPSLRDLYADYADKGFTIVGMHDPEFDYEKKIENVQEAVKKMGIKYPVAQDNDFVTWGKYNIRAWPTMVLVDKRGNIRYEHIGEGAYDETRAAVQALLAE